VLVLAGSDSERELLIEQGRISIEQAVRLKPTDPRSLFYLGVTLYFVGEADGSSRALADALANDPPPALRAEIEDFQASVRSNRASTTTTPG
jgi:cytochrome c-type biogenesis protein CcmH/NrfG